MAEPVGRRKKKAFYYFAEKGLPEYSDELYEIAFGRLAKEEARKPFIYGEQYYKNLTKSLTAFSDYWKGIPYTPSKKEEDDYLSGFENIHEQYEKTTRSSGDYREQTKEEYINKELLQLGKDFPDKMVTPFTTIGKGLQSSSAMKSRYDTVYNIPIGPRESDVLFNTLDTIPEGVDMGFAFHHGSTFSQIGLGDIGEKLNQKPPESLYMMTCAGGSCVNEMGLANTETYYRPGATWQGVYTNTDDMLTTLFGRYDDEVSKNPQKGKHYEIVPPGKKAKILGNSAMREMSELRFDNDGILGF